MTLLNFPFLSGLAVNPLYYLLAVAFSLLLLNLGALLASFSDEVVLPNAPRKDRGAAPVATPTAAPVGTNSDGGAPSANALQEPLLNPGGTEITTEATVSNGEAAVLTAAFNADAKEEKEAAAAAETSEGWSALFAIAAPQKGWLLTASAVLLVRLPFSLAGPHFVSSVLGAVIDGDAEQAHYFVLCLLAVRFFCQLKPFEISLCTTTSLVNFSIRNYSFFSLSIEPACCAFLSSSITLPCIHIRIHVQTGGHGRRASRLLDFLLVRVRATETHRQAAHRRVCRGAEARHGLL